MPLPPALGKVNKRVGNRLLLKLVGRGPLAELTHVGRRSGKTYRTPIMAFRDAAHPGVVTIALTYGPRVDWLRNVAAAGGADLRLGGRRLSLGPPQSIGTHGGLSRMPTGPRQLLPLIGCREFVELSVRADLPQ